MACNNLFSQNVLKVTAGGSIKLTGGAVLVLNNMNLENDGTISLSSGDGTFLFNGNITTTISGTSMPLFDRIELAKTGTAQLQLQRNISAVSGINFISGILNLNNNNILLQTNALITGENELRRITGTNGGFVEITALLNNPSSVNPANLGAIITANLNLGSTIIRRGHQAQTIGTGSSINRYFDIIPTNNTSLNATLRFTYFDAELNALDENSIVVWKSPDNIAWTELGADSRNITLNYVEKTNIPDFTRQTLALPSGALPVIFTFINAQCRSGLVILTWKTAQEMNSSRFDIERSINGRDWIVIGSVAAAGNSMTERTYHFSDSNPLNGIGLYRIAEYDINGSALYTSITRTACEPGDKVDLWPNPAEETTWLNIQLSAQARAIIKVYDVKGSLIIKQGVTLLPGSNQVPISLRSLSSGIYQVLVDYGVGQPKMMKLVKQ